MIKLSKNNKSRMTPSQKTEIEKRSVLYKQGKLTLSSWNEIKKRTHLK
jgi:hypothetical protein